MASGRQILVVVFLVFGIFLYGIFIGLPEEGQTTVGSPKGKEGITSSGDYDLPSSADVKTPWRSFNYKQLNVPASISSGANQVKPSEATVVVDGLTVFYREVNPQGAHTNISVLLLHGAAFKSETWYNLGTLGNLSLMGYRVVAIDMPGFGNSPAGTITDKAAFVQHLLAALHLNNPVIVSPSLSGQLSLPFLVKHWQQMAGYVPVAPVGWNVLEQVQCNTGDAPVDVSQVLEQLRAYLPNPVPNLSCIKVPTMVVFGEHDRGSSSALLNLLPNSVAVEIPNGRHPAYLDDPKLWHQALYNFLLRLRQHQQQATDEGS
ncbi:putative protein-lysine deacylase ABHD14B isoform X3 [Rhipicephalus sanguineus]|uniref:putative protein-lysine deacylase ABHD14B isoform X3 n=1 Tax=Rhipicephalus sanguineus TaxID=34632 RepID=UPI0020C36B4F|nr:putative protein-lysine deacylase ABHD14B isoform X3 [Rhipicephalus sanguineus]